MVSEDKSLEELTLFSLFGGRMMPPPNGHTKCDVLLYSFAVANIIFDSEQKLKRLQTSVYFIALYNSIMHHFGCNGGNQNNIKSNAPIVMSMYNRTC